MLGEGLSSNMNLTQSPLAKPRRYTRVRTGCLTCRLRKIKCDEQRPVCHNCHRLRRDCAYEDNNADASVLPTSSFASMPTTDGMNLFPEEEPFLNANLDFGEWGDTLQFGDRLASPSMIPSPSALSNSPASQGVLQDGAAMFPYFSSNVNPPFITPFDSVNWEIMRQYITQLGTQNSFIAAAIRCVEILYQTLGHDRETSDAMHSYFLAKSAYLTMLKSEDQGLEAVLITTFLLCCFEMVAQQETNPHTLKPKDPLIFKVGVWAKTQPWPPIARRITVWLRWFHTKAMHLGGRGILSPQLIALLPSGRYPVPSLFFLKDEASDPGIELFEAKTNILFHFYDELQDISLQASGLNRHHRSRGTLADETGVHWISTNIGNHLDILWQARPRLLCRMAGRSPSESRTSDGAEDLLVQLCRTCYFAEILYLDRAHSKDHTTSRNAQWAMQQIRQSIDEFCSLTATQHLDPAFIWPLFLYAVEIRTVAGVDWALSKLGLIKNTLWQSDNIATFVRDLTKEQLSRGERVDSRFFSLERYGGAPPYI